MASSINIKVNSDFAAASKDLQKFGAVTEAEAKRIERFTKSFKTEQIDNFIDKNRRAGAAVKATQGDMKSMETQQKALQRQMESLIRRGMDPQDEAIQKLNKEYQRLETQIKKNADAQKGMEMATKGAVAGLTAIATAVVAVGLAAVKSTFEIGAMGDQLAKTSRVIGVGVETMQELAFAAERVGLPASTLDSLFKKMNRNVGDLQANTGTLTTFLNKSNPALAEQLKNVDDSEQAFNMLINAIAEAPTEFEKASLAQAAFGRSGQDLILFANEGVDGINALREEAQRYGIISEETALKAEAFADAQRNIKQALTGARAELADKLLPAFTQAINKIANFVADGEKLKKTLEIIGYALAGVTAGLVTFLILTKGAQAIQAFATAFKVLNAAMAANPAIAIATLIVAILIPAIIFLIKNWDTVVLVFNETLIKLQERFKIWGSKIKEAWIKSVQSIKIAFLDLAGVIIDKVFGSVRELLDFLGKLPFVGEMFQNLSSKVGELEEGLNSAREGAIAQAEATIAAAQAEQDAIEAAARNNIQAVRDEAAARRAVREQEEAEAEAFRQEQADQQEGLLTTGLSAESLAARLNELSLTEQQQYNQRISTYQKFLNERANLAGVEGQARIDFLIAESERIKELDTITGEERIEIQRQIQEEITALEAEENDKRYQQAADSLTKYGNFAVSIWGSINQIRSNMEQAELNDLQTRINAEEEGTERRIQLEQEYDQVNKEFAVKKAKRERNARLFEAIINGAAAVVSFLAQGDYVGAILAGVMAGVEVGVIASEPLPTAQTGGTFEIPDTGASSRADSVGLAVSPGETVSVSPRGEESGRSITINNYFDKELLWSATQEGIDAGEITFTNDNLVAG